MPGFILTPQDAALIATSLAEIAAGQVLIKDPTTLAGFQSLGPALVSGNLTGIEASAKLLVAELNISNTGGIGFVLDAAVNAVKLSNNPLTPTIITGMFGSILTDIGTGVNQATALFVANNPTPAPAAKAA
jgi:hypothetical protein